MERAERRLDAAGDVSLWKKRPRARIADSAGAQSRADLLSFLRRILIRPAIHAIKPGDSESAGHRVERLAVDSDDYDRFRPGDAVNVGTKRRRVPRTTPFI